MPSVFRPGARRLAGRTSPYYKHKPRLSDVWTIRGDMTPSVLLALAALHHPHVCVWADCLCSYSLYWRILAQTDWHKHAAAQCAVIIVFLRRQRGQRAPVCHTWGSMSDMAPCLQAWLVTLLNCCNLLLLHWPAVAWLFFISPCRCPQVRKPLKNSSLVHLTGAPTENVTLFFYYLLNLRSSFNHRHSVVHYCLGKVSPVCAEIRAPRQTRSSEKSFPFIYSEPAYSPAPLCSSIMCKASRSEG